MPSQLKLHRTFAECEAENLKTIERLQGYFFVVIANAQGELAAYSSNLTQVQASAWLERVDFAQLLETPVPRLVSLAVGDVLVHFTSDGHWCFEFDPQASRSPSSAWTFPSPIQNLARFAQQVCDMAYDELPYNRVLVYQFHSDESGEVIAERIDEGLEPFIGLHYPATDIPRQARELYSQLPARMVFSNTNAQVALRALDGEAMDITQLVSRGVSPFHLQYLTNMGSASTASVGIEVDGRLWGLLSMHSDQPLRPSLGLYAQLAELKGFLGTAFRSCLSLVHEATYKRNRTLIQRYEQHLASEFDLAYSLLLGGFSLHRLVGGIGAAVMVGDKVAQVGETPLSEHTRALFEKLNRQGPATLYCDNVQGEKVFENTTLGGYAFVVLSESPWAALMIFRRQVVQTVTWGGDPRNAAVAGGVSQSYTPRASFERWTELVQGQCMPWEPRTVELLEGLLEQCRNRFESSPGTMGPLLDYSLQQMVHTRTRILQRLNEQFEQLRQGIAIAVQSGEGSDRSILSINYAASIAFNMSSQEAEGMRVDQFADSTNIPVTALESGSVTQVSVWTNDSGHRDLEVEVQQQFDFQTLDPSAALSIQVFYLSDITQSKRVEMALQAAYRKSERLAAAQHEMFAKLMHEMRTPLNSIIGFSSFLSDPKLIPSERDDFIQRIVRNADTLHGLLRRSHDHMQVLHAEVQQSTEVCQLAESLEDIIEDLAIAAAERGIEIEISEFSEDADVLIPRASLRQIVVNLINNALKFSASGQVVSVAAVAQGSGVELSVADRGIGMTPEQVATACEPFVRHTRCAGSGLGLSIVKQLVEASGGQIRIDSDLGSGTTVVVSLPVDSRLHLAKSAPDVSDITL